MCVLARSTERLMRRIGGLPHYFAIHGTEFFHVRDDAVALHNVLQFFPSVILAPAVNFKATVLHSRRVGFSDGADDAKQNLKRTRPS